MHSEVCPICRGSGIYDGRTCHGCGGKGWIEVQDSYSPPYEPCTPYKPYWKDEYYWLC